MTTVHIGPRAKPHKKRNRVTRKTDTTGAPKWLRELRASRAEKSRAKRRQPT